MDLKTKYLVILLTSLVLGTSVCGLCGLTVGAAFWVTSADGLSTPRIIREVSALDPVQTAKSLDTETAADVTDTEVSPMPVTFNQIPASTPAPTNTLTPTNTPIPTETPAPTNTSIPTDTPLPPTFTPIPIPTNTPTPAFMAQTRQIGPIYDSLRETSYSVEVTLKDVAWLRSEDYKSPKPGNIYLITYVQIKNLGPSALNFIGPSNFQMLDANGSLRDYELISSAMDTCYLDHVDLMANGSVEGCVSFEVPLEGKLELIYAPYQYNGLEEGRYLSLPVR